MSRDRVVKLEVFNNSVKLYFTRVDGYLEIVLDIASKYNGMSLIAFDGYFEDKMELAK